MPNFVLKKLLNIIYSLYSEIIPIRVETDAVGSRTVYEIVEKKSYTVRNLHCVNHYNRSQGVVRKTSVKYH